MIRNQSIYNRIPTLAVHLSFWRSRFFIQMNTLLFDQILKIFLLISIKCTIKAFIILKKQVITRAFEVEAPSGSAPSPPSGVPPSGT